jgi:hypothetical protein
MVLGLCSDGNLPLDCSDHLESSRVGAAAADGLDAAYRSETLDL